MANISASASYVALVTRDWSFAEELASDGLLDANTRGLYGETPLHQAAWRTDFSRADVEKLLNFGADPALVDERGATPAQIARKCGRHAVAVALETHCTPSRTRNT